jgi:Ca2+/Na+ antiporter
VALLVIAWKWELIGGILFILLGVGFSPVVYNINYHRNHSIMMSLGIVLMVTFPFILVGGLFMLSHLLKKKESGIPVNENVMAAN